MALHYKNEEEVPEKREREVEVANTTRRPGKKQCLSGSGSKIAACGNPIDVDMDNFGAALKEVDSAKLEVEHKCIESDRERCSISPFDLTRLCRDPSSTSPPD